MQTLRAPGTGKARRASRGFTLLETLLVVGIAGILSSLAYPSLEGHLLRARRSDALVALMQVQLAQERFRASNRSYGELVDLGVGDRSMSGYYRLQVIERTADGYTIAASAVGRQLRDGNCRTLRLTAAGASVVYDSGPDLAASNPADDNRRCWSR